jgi:hypothetical protein
MDILGHMEAVHGAMREVTWRISNSNHCTMVVDWRLISDIYDFYSAVVYDEDVGFCTLIGTLDNEYHIRDIFHGIELWQTYEDIVVNNSNQEVYDLFLSRLSEGELSMVAKGE